MTSIPEDIAQEAQAIARSGLIAGSWYAATYPDVSATGLKPSEHFAWFGSRMGRKPIWGLDTRFYRETNAQRMGPGENPVAYHLREGRALGRPLQETTQVYAVQKLARHLWGALPGEAAEALRAVADGAEQGERARFVALVELAGRADFDGRTEEAAAILARTEAETPRHAATKAALMRRGMLAERLGEAEAARGFFEAVPRRAGPAGEPEPDPDAMLGLANLEPDAAGRLAAVNALHARRRLEPLAPVGPAFDFAGLGAAEARGGLPYLGLVSVIVPAFRAAGSLPTALRSLAAQSYPHLEIIVVDDASPDDTLAVAEAAAARDPRIRPVRAPRNGGAYAARNVGLGLARGAYVTTHDADDWSHPRKIEAQLRSFLADPEVMGNAVFWARARADMRFTTNWRLGAAILHLSYSSLMLRREAADALGPWDEVRTGADSEYLWRLQRVFGPGGFAHVEPDTPLAFGLDEDGSLTRSKATHLASNYHGLRLTYREVVRHHIATARDPNDPAARAASLARVPLRMRGLPEPEEPLDLLATCDLFDRRAVERLAAILAERPDARVGVLHEPTLASDGRRFAAALWPLIDGERVRLLTEDPGPGGARGRVRAAAEPLVTPPGDADMEDADPSWTEEGDG